MGLCSAITARLRQIPSLRSAAARKAIVAVPQRPPLAQYHSPLCGPIGCKSLPTRRRGVAVVTKVDEATVRVSHSAPYLDFACFSAALIIASREPLSGMDFSCMPLTKIVGVPWPPKDVTSRISVSIAVTVSVLALQ